MLPLDSSPTSKGKHWHCARLSDSHAFERSCYKKSNYEAANVKTVLSFLRPITQWSPRRLIQNTLLSILETTSTNERSNQTIAEKSRPIRVRIIWVFLPPSSSFNYLVLHFTCRNYTKFTHFLQGCKIKDETRRQSKPIVTQICTRENSFPTSLNQPKTPTTTATTTTTLSVLPLSVLCTHLSSNFISMWEKRADNRRKR